MQNLLMRKEYGQRCTWKKRVDMPSILTIINKSSYLFILVIIILCDTFGITIKT